MIWLDSDAHSLKIKLRQYGYANVTTNGLVLPRSSTSELCFLAVKADYSFLCGAESGA
jgi:hypothetical protein